MEKDRSITDFIKKLGKKIDISAIDVIDYWDGDLFAIGIKKDDRLVYINTFNPVKQETILYDYDLELLSDQIDKFKTIRQGLGVSEDELITEIKSFLEV